MWELEVVIVSKKIGNQGSKCYDNMWRGGDKTIRPGSQKYECQLLNKANNGMAK